MSKVSIFTSRNRGGSFFAIASLTCLALLSAAQSAQAHHAMGGKLPATFFEGFISGLAHPVVGFDHLAFVIAIGLIAVGRVRGALIPGAFVLAAMAGTGIHLLRVDLPIVEIVISLSVIALGAILSQKQELSFPFLATLAAVAGLFHGYAYGESIVGAEMTPLVAYLAGFTVIQYAIALLALGLGNLIRKKASDSIMLLKRYSGYAITIIGMIFLTTSIVG